MKNLYSGVAAKGYLKTLQVKESYKKALTNEDGSQALEYTFVIGAAVALAGVLGTVVKSSEIKEGIKDFIVGLF